MKEQSKQEGSRSNWKNDHNNNNNSYKSNKSIIELQRITRPVVHPQIKKKKL